MWDDESGSDEGDWEAGADTGDVDDLFGGGEVADAPAENPWADEDAEEPDGDWDADSDEEKAKEEEKKKKAAAKPKQPKKKSRKDILREKEEAEAKERMARAVLHERLANMTDEQKADMKAREQANRERAELNVASDLFGGEADDMGFMAPDPVPDNSHPAYAPIVIKEELKLSDKKDHVQYAKDIAKKLKEHKSSKVNQVAFVKELLNQLSEGLALENVTAIRDAVKITVTKKVKERSNKNKKKKNNKASLKMSHDDYYDSTNTYGGDFDFI